MRKPKTQTKTPNQDSGVQPDAIQTGCGLADAAVDENGRDQTGRQANSEETHTWVECGLKADSAAQGGVAPMILPDIEIVSAKVHDAWMATKRQSGVTSRKSENGEELMVPYAKLSETAKELDRATVRTVYEAIKSAMEEGKAAAR
jgi:hypothetical protein